MTYFDLIAEQARRLVRQFRYRHAQGRDRIRYAVFTGLSSTRQQRKAAQAERLRQALADAAATIQPGKDRP